MNAQHFISGIEKNIFSSKFDSTRLERWKIKLTDIVQSTVDHKEVMECLMKYIEYVINYGCSINNQKDQIAICRTYFGVVEVLVVSREYQNLFIQELSDKIFDIVIEEDANSWCIKKEVLKVFIKCARKVDKHIRQQIISHLPKIYLFKLFDSISTYSDYDLQVLLIETLFCMYGKDIISSKLKDLIPESENLSENFDSINLDMFYESVRKFLNVLNKTSTKMFSIKCCNIKLGNFICVQNTDELDGPWVNFDLWNNSVSWYCCNSTFHLGDEHDQDSSNYILLFSSDVKTVMVDSSSDRSGLMVTFKLKNPCICNCEEIQNYVDKCDSFYMLLNQSKESGRLVSEILPQIFRKKVVQDGIRQKKVIKNKKGNYKPLNISKSKNTSNISCTTNWFCQSATTSPSSKNENLFRDDVVMVADTSLSHTESEDFLVEMSNNRYQTPPSEMADDVISLHSSLSNELLSIHDEKEHFQILSGRCSKSNVNVFPLFRNKCKGVSRFSQAINNRMGDIVEENETHFQTAHETAMEEFQTAEDMTNSQVINCKASRAINDDAESINSLKVNIFMDMKSQPISTSNDIIENVSMEGNNLSSNQAIGLKVSKSTKTTREKYQGFSFKNEDKRSKVSKSSKITNKCPKLSLQHEQLPGMVSKKKKENDNSIETVQEKNKSLEAVALKRRGRSQSDVEDLPLGNSSIEKKKVSKYMIPETLHTNMPLEKYNEETAVSKRNCNDINKNKHLCIDSEQSEKVWAEKEQSHKLISVKKNDNLDKQVDAHLQNVDKENMVGITNKSYQKSKNEGQTIQAIEKIHCSKWIRDGVYAFENEEQNADKMKGKLQSTKNVEEINFSKLIEDTVGIVQDEKEYTKKMKKGRYRKPKKNVTTKVVKQINFPPNCGHDPYSLKSMENDSSNNNSDKGTRECTNYSQLIKDRSDAFDATKKNQSDPIAVEETDPPKLVESNESGLASIGKDNTQYQSFGLNKEMYSPKCTKDSADSFDSIEKQHLFEKIAKKSCYQETNNNIQSLKTVEEINPSKLITYKSCSLESAWQGTPPQAHYETRYEKSKNILQLAETNEEDDSQKSIRNRSDGSEIIKKNQPDKIVDKNICRKFENIHEVETTEEINSQNLSEHNRSVFRNTQEEKLDQVDNSVHEEIKNQFKQGETAQIPVENSKKIQLNETVEEIYCPKISDNNSKYPEIPEIEGTQISIKTLYKESKDPITLTETGEVQEFSVLVNGKTNEKFKQIESLKKDTVIEYNDNELVSFEKMKTKQTSNNGQSPKILQTKADHVDEKSSVENKMDVETSLHKFRDIVILLTPIKIRTCDSIVREKNEEEYNLEKNQICCQLSKKSINKYLSEVEENFINSKENRCPNLNHQTLNKKSKLYNERPLMCNLETTITNVNETSTEQNNILKEVMNSMGKKAIDNKNICKQTSISKNNLTGSTEFFGNFPKENTTLTREIIRDIPTESLLEDIHEENRTLENILHSPQNNVTVAQVSNKDIDRNLDIMGVSKNTDIPKKKIPSNDAIFTENSNPTKDIEKNSTVSNKYLTDYDNQPVTDNVLSKSKQIDILEPKQLVSNGKPTPKKNIVLNQKIHNEPIDIKKSKLDKCKEAQNSAVAEQSLDAIKQFIEASFDHSNKDSNQTLSTTVSGKRKRKLYNPGDLSFLDVLKKRPIVVNEVIRKSTVIENKSVDVNTVAVDCSLNKKQEKPILDEQLKHVTKSPYKRRKLHQNETQQLQSIEDCVKMKKKTTFLEEQVDKRRKSTSVNQKVNQKKIKQSRSEKHNATEELRGDLQSSFRNILESFRQERAMTSVMDYVRKPKMQNKKKTRGKPLASTMKSKHNNRKFSMDRVMRLDKLDLSNSTTSSMKLRAPQKRVKALPLTPPTPFSDPPEEIPVIPIEANTKKIHVTSDILLVPAPAPKKKSRLMPVVESSRMEGEAVAHLESELVNNRDEDQMSISIDKSHLLVSYLAPEWRGTAIVDRNYTSIGSKDYLGKYYILFFYPLDFGHSEVHEPTDVIVLSRKMDDFRNLNCDAVACSVDHHLTHMSWISKLESSINFPILADPSHVISKSFGVYMKDTAYTYRSCFFMNPNGIIIWQETVGVQYEMNIERILQIIQHLQSYDT